jgi:hypothetical protein
VNSGTVVFDSVMRRAISVCVRVGSTISTTPFSADGAAAASMSALTMRPPRPDPATAARSTPSSRASRRASGDAFARGKTADTDPGGGSGGASKLPPAGEEESAPESSVGLSVLCSPGCESSWAMTAPTGSVAPSRATI